jgi:D-aminopeptidase
MKLQGFYITRDYKSLLMSHPCSFKRTMTTRARALGIIPGILPPGALNAITDVQDVRVGHFTLIEGDDIRTGATAILPHGENLFQEKTPAGLAVGNGFGKMMGSTQLQELGELETPIILTNTLAVPRAADAILDWTLAQPGNEDVRSINPVVGETNDGILNNIRRRALTPEMLLQAIASAATGPVPEGSVGAGTGTVAFGWKGGIGTSSRILPSNLGGFTVGVLVQSNFGGVLQILGVPVGQKSDRYYLKDKLEPDNISTSLSNRADGSIMMLVATDAPLSDRNLTRLAWRAMAGLARTGASMSNGSGDYAIAFSTAETVRRTGERRESLSAIAELPNNLMSPLFQATIEATEEAIYNSLCMATAMTGYQGHHVEALSLDLVMSLMREY